MKELISKKLDGRTQRWLCVQCNMTDVDLSNSINGYRRFKQIEFKKVCEVLGFTAKEKQTVLVDYQFQKD